MESRTFSSPDVRFDSEIEFCAPSWQRKRKYLSWNHWLTTKTARGKQDQNTRSLRYKLYELGHYAGSVILEIGLSNDSNSCAAIKAAKQAHQDSQYFAITSDAGAIDFANRRLKRKQIDSHAVFFRGTLAEFRNIVPVTPTMVIVNNQQNVDSTLSHLALFLSEGTPVFVRDWYTSRADLRPQPNAEHYDYCGRFGESILLVSKSQQIDKPKTCSFEEFQNLREQVTARGEQDISSISESAELKQVFATSSRAQTNKSWPFSSCEIDYPPTLPDGTAWPKISVVTPTYNQGKFIEQTINSVLNQGYPNLEYIIVDGASTDETSEVLEAYRDRIDHLISEPDEGQSDAINKGMDLTTGEILTWLNSDDMFTPGTLFAMAMAFWKSKADMVVGTVQLLKDDRVVSEHLTSCENGPLQLSELLDLDNNWLKGRFFYQPELMFTRDLWERSGGYVDTDLYYSMDHELWLRFAIAGANLHVIGRPTVLYRVHDEQKTHEDYTPELRSVNRRYIERFGSRVSPLTTLQPKKYRVTFVNDVGVRYGAGIAHGRLRDSIAAAGHETQFVAATTDERPWPKTEGELYTEIEETNPDLVVFGNLHNASIGMGLVDRVSDRWAACFVMHDLWMSTGRCCYLGGCNKFKSSCDSACPTATEYPSMNPEQIETAFEKKLNVISKPRKLVVMTNSEWTRQVAEESAITSKSVLKRVKYGFPTHIFKPRDKKLCRELLGLPQDAFIVLFASVNVAEERKGLRHLFEALNRLQLENLVPVCIGHAHDHADLYPGTIALGYVDDPRRGSLIYSAADIFVGPSLQEAFGQVFVEAGACGTPSIAYPIGGVEDAIIDGVTGRLAKHVHPSALADEILKLYSDGEYRRQLGIWARIEIENEWSYRSAYHHFNGLLRQLPEHIGFLPPANIAFDPAKTEGLVSKHGNGFGLLDKIETKVVPSSGFADKENITLDDGQEHSARWAVGQVCELRVFNATEKPQTLVAECLNPVADQSIDVTCNGSQVGTVIAENRDTFHKSIQLELVRDLAPGEHVVRLQFAKTIKEQIGQRDLAMMFLNLELKPTAAEKVSATFSQSEQKAA